ncbi:hypothetical protein G4Y79_02410 [Phototrophicus methaneseepsis]|uniref:Uncharacterized protein n=1 Tax=Phototrophicus methaneseepsis TaxID=2710758 RepID=A0A7S8IF84_9CHLR|nr:hypothetical protein [Phototrophicus methaneseepsis]QPC83249.1 hypothetical protein G4Y79_02410 [Phototrophicus methaneseepsis]
MNISQRVYHIGDFRWIDVFPVNLRDIKLHTPHLDDPKLRYALMLYNNVKIPYLGNIVTRLAGNPFKAFREPEALLAFLSEQEPELVIPEWVREFLQDGPD